MCTEICNVWSRDVQKNKIKNFKTKKKFTINADVQPPSEAMPQLLVACWNLPID